AQLVRLAGARPPVPGERAARVEKRVFEAWLAGVAARRRFRWMSWGAGLAAAAGVAVTVGLLWRHASLPPPAPVLVATVERVSGSVTTAGVAGEQMPLLPGAQVFAGTPIATGADGRVALRLAAARASMARASCGSMPAPSTSIRRAARPCTCRRRGRK